MTTQAEREQYALSLISRRVLRVDRAGRIWIIGRLCPNGTVRRHAARRAESTSRNGYLRLRLRAGGRVLSVMAHRLVYLHFRGPIPEGNEVHHGDFDRRNNKPDNLEALTRTENMQQRGGDITEREWCEAVAMAEAAY